MRFTNLLQLKQFLNGMSDELLGSIEVSGATYSEDVPPGEVEIAIDGGIVQFVGSVEDM